MRQRVLCSLWLTLLGALLLPATARWQDIKAILASDYEYKMISSGRNRPTVNIENDHLGDICILLHHHVPLGRVKEYFQWSDQELQNRLDTLVKEQLIKKDKKFGYVPTFMVITLEDGKELSKVDRNLEKQVVKLIISKLPQIRNQYADIDAFKLLPIQRVSLLILSNVLLDNWQIRNVEREFLHANRPSRNGMHYYYSIQEKTKAQTTEAFGIYGNMNSGFGSVSVGIYGNQRQGLNFITIDKPQMRELFGMPESDDIWKFKQSLLEELLRWSSDPNHALKDHQHEIGFERLGLIVEGKLNVPILRATDQQKLSELAALITSDLVRSLESRKAKLEKSYRRSRYSHEVTFEEYAIWWYHFFYTGVTENLIAKGLIEKPSDGIFTYLISQ